MELDPRGVRFGATIGSIMFAVVLITGWAWPAVFQAVVFALTALSPGNGPYSHVFRKVLLPRLEPPAELEPAAPVRFAQTVGFAFAAVAAVGFFTDIPALGIIAAALGLMASFLNAAFGYCLGCTMYLLIRRLTT
ncbi:DUF4395 domain-containing protein [Actinoplanes sp. NBRC 103695]|uniref:DUF4395 domain-containing protein n=1 Tax=Actinoplanes sp. NBRC 103695 TaxID=3032202 RepID=UPI002556BCB6|nr:DUF4395 domain-containing protein [Actinoplanes sp. NBRC 103695]